MTKGQASPTTAADWTAGKLTPHGSGIRPFQPAAIALAAGATFIGRAFSGRSNEIAKMLVQAVEHPGFSFVQVLSPCPTFRPEQQEWKHVVRPFERDDLPTDDAAEAARCLQLDDGMSTGVIYVTQRPVWQPVRDARGNLADIERGLLV